MNRSGFVLGVLSLAMRPSGQLVSTSQDRLATIERRFGGRLGVVIWDTDDGARVERRPHARFALCSTFKWFAVAALLARVDKGLTHLGERVTYSRRDLLDYSPVTSAHVADGSMSLGALCRAAICQSDNTAGNLILRAIGGPSGFTRYARTLGDPLTRLDRTEPDLNEATPGDARDTTTPSAMMALMHEILVGSVLSAPSRALLLDWLRASTTGAQRLRAGLPSSWVVGDKTGTGGHGETNDVAIARPPNRQPLLIAAYFAESPAGRDARDAALAQVGQVAAQLVR